MRKTTIYLDTSVINFLFADDAPEKEEVTVDFFEHYVRPGIYDVVISPIVLDEINRTKDRAKREKLLEVIAKYGVEVVSDEENLPEIGRLAQRYIEKGIIPADKVEDALHIAVATVHQMDVLLSWNYRHLANVNKEAQILAANLCEGYSKPLRMVTPMEVVYRD
jgi:predicted nucleic acid-binding protein